MNHEPNNSAVVWCLTGRLDEKSSIKVFPITYTPFQVGRRFGMGLTLPSKLVSGRHAEIVEENDALWVYDQGSTNGTFVNGEAVGARHRIEEGDLIQFADVALRLGRVSTPDHCCQTQNGEEDIQDQAVALVQLERLLQEHAVDPHFQPVVTLPDREIIGYEALARSRLFGLQTPADMFIAASQLNQAEELSRMLRLVSLEIGSNLPESAALHLNSHPSEIVTYDLLASLRILRKMEPNRTLTLDVHESSIKDSQSFQLLRDALSSLNIQMSLDDVGDGHSRLLELAKFSPDIVKFDMHLIRGIHLAASEQRRLLTHLVRSASDLGIATLAEGVECEEEHEVCCDVGFALAQGYFYGRPERLKAVLSEIEHAESKVN